MTTAADWLSLTTTSRKVLATVSNVRETLVGWSRVGATTAYSVTWLSQTHSGQPKSAYRAITGVMINGTALTSRASLALVQANASSWFWDSATSTLYVSSSSGASPSTFSWVGAVFSLYFSTDTIADSVLYEPRVTGQLPTIRNEEYDLTLGATSSASGTLSLLNADGCFDDLAWKYAWHNATVTLAVGGGDMLLADYVAAGTLQIVGAPAPKDDICVFQLRAFDNQTKARVFPLNTYGDDLNSQPNLPADSPLLSQFLPMFWGFAYGIPATYIYTAGGYRYDVFGYYADPTVGTAVYAVHRVTGAVTSVTPVNASFGVALVDAVTYPTDTYDIYVDAYNAAGLTIASIPVIILQSIGVPSTQINTAAFTAAAAIWPAKLSVYVPGGSAPDVFVSVGEIFRQIEQSCLGRIYMGTDGRWTIDLYDPSVPLAANVLNEELMTVFAPNSTIQEAMAQSMRVQYRYNVRTQGWQSLTVSANPAAYQYQTTEVLNFPTCLTEEHYATLLAGRLAWMNSLPTTRVVIDGPPVAITLKPRDKVRVIRQRAPGATGSWADPGIGMEIEAVAARPSDCRAEVTVGNMRGIGGAVKVAAPNGTADWSSASGLEKLIYGFALDNSTERADVSDASTFQQNRAW